jgi:hypothetical protein
LGRGSKKRKRATVWTYSVYSKVVVYLVKLKRGYIHSNSGFDGYNRERIKSKIRRKRRILIMLVKERFKIKDEGSMGILLEPTMKKIFDKCLF